MLIISLFTLSVILSGIFGYMLCRIVHWDAIEDRASLDAHVTVDDYICADAPEFDPYASQFTPY